MEGSRTYILNDMHNMKRGMGFAIEQVDQLQQNLQVESGHQPLPLDHQCTINHHTLSLNFLELE
eukprot:5812241-Prorocentrum_lima.AAC.1